jgi:hypothetical protein
MVAASLRIYFWYSFVVFYWLCNRRPIPNPHSGDSVHIAIYQPIRQARLTWGQSTLVNCPLRSSYALSVKFRHDVIVARAVSALRESPTRSPATTHCAIHLARMLYSSQCTSRQRRSVKIAGFWLSSPRSVRPSSSTLAFHPSCW